MRRQLVPPPVIQLSPLQPGLLQLQVVITVLFHSLQQLQLPGLSQQELHLLMY